VLVKLVTPSSGELSAETYAELNVLCGAVRHAAHLVDTPTCDLDTTALVGEVAAVAARHAATVKKTVISGEALREAGLNAIYGVGKAARAPPALAVLEYTPAKPAAGATKLALVGKGIVYDTGGLSLKPTASMCEMKTDCGGAIALLAAFDALVKLETPFPVVYVGCIAENALGSGAQRNDDIIIPLSGKSIEINNTGEGTCWTLCVLTTHSSS
jgi:probable aminopeptidase NPEPL1